MHYSDLELETKSNMSNAEPAGVEKVKEALAGLGYGYSPVVLPKSARTSVEAAEALGCSVAQIAKSLVFRGRDSGRGVLVVASGVNRVDEKRLGRTIGEKVQKPDADFVREVSGFTIGGVPPVGLAGDLETIIDEDLLQHEVVWAAAGNPKAVFSLDPKDLESMTGGRVMRVK